MFAYARLVHAVRHLDRGDGVGLAYRYRQGRGPALVFLPGYMSDMDGTKAAVVDGWAGAEGRACLRFDYSGCGASGGAFADGTISRWRDDALAVIDAVAPGPVVLVGSSMGGWIALLVALARPALVRALVGIAAAPDFTDWGYTPEQRQSLIETSRFETASADGGARQVTHARFVESGAALRMLHSPILIDCPVRLIHGDQDQDVPVGVAFKLLDSIHSGDVQLLLIKQGGHRLSQPHEIEALMRTIAVLAESFS